MGDVKAVKAIPPSGDATALQELEIGDTQSVANGGTGKSSIAADKILYSTAADTLGEATITAAGRSILDDADAAAQRGTLDIERSGTFTPVVADAASGGNVATGTISGDYVETDDYIDIVIAITNVDTTGLTATNDLFIRNFPHPVAAALSGANSRAVGGVDITNYTASANATILNASALRNNAYANLRESFNNSSAGNNVTVSQIASGTADIYFSMRYPK